MKENALWHWHQRPIIVTVVIYKSRVFVTGRVFQFSIIFVPANFRLRFNWLIVVNRLGYYNRKSFKIKISRVSFLLGSLEQDFYFKLGCFVTSVILLYAQLRPHRELKPGPGFVLLANVCPWSELKRRTLTIFSTLWAELYSQHLLVFVIYKWVK